jgi:cytochrome c peroxidase
MLSPLKNSPACLSYSTILTMTLCSLLVTTPATAEIVEQYRQEPILPIPEKIEVDTDKANLGELLFFDTRLSHDRQIACASCHQLDAGGDDNVAMGVSTTSGQHIINTPSIFNARYNFRQNWDGSVKTLIQQVDKAVSNRHVFNNSWDDIITTLSKDHELTTSFQATYQQDITRENIIDAIVEFEKTLVTPNSRFDRYLRHEEDALTDEEIDGYLTFKELGCISCHQGINIGGNLYQKFGVFYNYIAERGEIKPADYGRMNYTNRQMDAFVFKVPSLRNISVTAPYLHDGSADTIEEAIKIMGKTQLGRTLKPDEIYLIKTFLNTLTGEYKNRSLQDPS